MVHKKDEGNVLGAGTLTPVTSYQLASHGITMTDALILKIILQILREYKLLKVTVGYIVRRHKHLTRSVAIYELNSW